MFMLMTDTVVVKPPCSYCFTSALAAAAAAGPGAAGQQNKGHGRQASSLQQQVNMICGSKHCKESTK